MGAFPRGLMRIDRGCRLILSLLIAAAFAMPAVAQQPATPPAAPPPAAAPKPKPKPKPAAAAPAAQPASPAASVGGAKTKLLGQYGEWGAYAASPGGKKVCFAIAKPTSSVTVPPN